VLVVVPAPTVVTASYAWASERHRAPTTAGELAMTDDPEALAATWDAYKRTRDQHLRDQLIVRYAPLVKFVAGRVAVGLPQSVDQADLVSYGMFGLIDAIEKFDLDRGIKFETYAATRIKGAIVDELRAADWVPRSIRAKARSVERAIATLEAQLHRTPTDQELADEMEVGERELNDTLNQISYVGIVALDDVVGSGRDREAPTLGDTLPDQAQGPVAAFEVEEMKQILAGAINRLGDREKMVLTLYYYEGLTLADIGQVLGVTESRVCQIHTKAVLQLRSRIGAEREAS
jgi:RNA polymerase sigma factor for flagellar operon FliA